MEKITMNPEGAASQVKTTWIQRVPFWLLSILLVFIPIFVIPFSFSDFLFGKMALLTAVVLISVIISVFTAISQGGISLPGWRSLVVISIVPVATIASSLLSTYRSASLMGLGSEFNTAHFILLGFILICLVAANFQSKQRIFWSYIGILGIFSLVSLFHVIRFIFGPETFSFGGIFSSVVSNTVGGWNELGVYAGLAIILSFITIEFVEIGNKLKWAFYTALILGLGLLAVTNFYVTTELFGLNTPLTVLVGLVSLFVFVYFISMNYRSSKKMPVASFIVLVFCIIMTIGSSPIATYINEKAGIKQSDVLDVRPTASGTYTVAKELITKGGVVRAIFGVGPNRFAAAWGMFKPAEVNKTIFWNTDFNYGVGYIPSFVITVGILGLLAWLFFLVAIFWAGIRSAFAGIKDKFSLYLIISSLLASFYLWVIALFTVVGITILVLAFFSTGLLAASLIREKAVRVKEYTWKTSQKKGFVAVLALILVLIGTIAWGFEWSQRYVASMEIKKASSVLKGEENIPEAEALVATAIKRSPTNESYLRTFSQLKLIELQADFKKTGKNELTEKNRPILEQAIGTAEAAVRQNPTDYQNFIFLGQVYQTAGLLGIEKAGDAALSAYQQAHNLIPSSPLPAYLAGYLYTLAKDSANAKTVLEQALQLKPDFEEAYNLYAELQKANPSVQTSSSKDIQTTSSPAKNVDEKSTSTSTAATSTIKSKR